MRARGLLLKAVVAFAGVVLAAPAVATEKPSAAPLAKAELAYARYCVACHGPAGRGDGPLAADLRVPVPDLTTLASRNGGTYPQDRVLRIISSGDTVRGHGSPDMPAWGDAFRKTKGTEARTVDEAIRNLAEYLRTLQRPAK
jgi:mono/diheme cytochrome c family protein